MVIWLAAFVDSLELVVIVITDIRYLFDYPVALVAVEWLMLGSKEGESVSIKCLAFQARTERGRLRR